MSAVQMGPGGSPVVASPTPSASTNQSGYTYNATHAHAVVAFGAIVTAITFASVVARLYTRSFISKQLKLDDILALGALLNTIAVNVMQSVFAINFLEHMNAMVTPVNSGSKVSWATEVVYNVAVGCMKMTFLFQFYRIFRYVPVMRTVYLVAIIVVGTWSISQIILTILICVPIQANWDHDVANAKCLPTVVSTYLNASGTIITDVIVLFLPLPTLWSLRLSRSQKWAAFGIFGVGSIVPIISGGRIWSLGVAPPKGYLNTACWTIAELCAGVTTASLATIRHLLDRKLPTLTSGQRTIDESGVVSSVALQEIASQQFTHQPNGSEADLLETRDKSGVLNRRYSVPSFGKSWNNLRRLLTTSRKMGEADPAAQVEHLWLTPDLGSRTKIISHRNHETTIAEGAAMFLGEFGIHVETTWEVREIPVQ